MTARESATAANVLRVQRDGLWESGCYDERCDGIAPKYHAIGTYVTEREAAEAADRHAAQLTALPEAARCETCGQTINGSEP